MGKMVSQNKTKWIGESLGEAAKVLSAFAGNPANLEEIGRMASQVAQCFRSGNKVLVCGNGGSACDAIHFAEEFTGRYRKDRRALPAIAIADGAHLTCVGNDYGFDEVFARGVAAYAKTGDLLLAISTSGNSRNVIRAVETAREAGASVSLLLGREGGALKGLGDSEIIVAGDTTDRIQEIHMLVLHIIIELVERDLFPENYAA